MKIRLVDHTAEVGEANWGTCDLCAGTALFNFVRLKFQADDGTEPYWVDAWQDHHLYGPVRIEVSNLYDFASWLGDIEFLEGTRIDYLRLEALAKEYEEVNFA